jgi:hypothetical protein
MTNKNVDGVEDKGTIKFDNVSNTKTNMQIKSTIPFNLLEFTN